VKFGKGGIPEPKNARLAEYLLLLTEERSLPILVQMDLHAALRWKWKDKAWARSKGELEMVGRWFADPWKEPPSPYREKDQPSWNGTVEENVVRWLWSVTASGAKPYSGPEFLEFGIKGLANSARSAKFKEELIGKLKEIKNTEALWKIETPLSEVDASTAFLLDAIEKRPSIGERAAAAKLLSIFAPLSVEHNKQIRAFLDSTPDEAVARELRALLKE
jgi:hypothetical protein